MLVTAAQYLVVGLSYVGLGLGSFPGLRMNRPAIALAGLTGVVALQLVPLEAAWQAIDATTIVFLLGTMIVNAYLSYAGFFPWALFHLVQLTRSPFGILVLLTFGSGCLSAFFLNDTIALVFTPLIVGLTQSLKLNPVPYLLTLAGATNLGSVATLNGNPQNILIGSFSGVGYVTFARVMIPVAIAGLAVQVFLLVWLYPEVRSLTPQPYRPPERWRIHPALLRKTLGVATAMLLAFALGFPLAESALVAATCLLITRRIKPQRVLRDVDWGLLVLFCGLFVLTEGLRRFHILQHLPTVVQSAWGLVGVTAGLSNLISNVPAVLMLQALILPEDLQSWLLLAASSTLAGNLTLFGAVANLITAEAAARQGFPLSFGVHLRFGLPLTLVTLGLAYGWISWQVPAL